MTTKRYTADEIKVLAQGYDDGAGEYNYDERISAALHQAAEDCERLDWLAMQFVDVRVPGLFALRLAFSGAPAIGFKGQGDIPFDIRSAIDTARTQEKARD